MNTYTLKDIVDFLWSKRKQVLWFCAAVFVLSAIVSLLLPNEYKATTRFYAAGDDLGRPEVMFGVTKDRPYFYGGNNERDRLLSISSSQLLLNELMKKHNLYAHYDVDSSGDFATQELAGTFFTNFSVVKNDLDALELSFIDCDREFAAEIANDATAALNHLASGIMKKSQAGFIETLRSKVNTGKLMLNSVSDSIQRIRNNFGFYDSQNQVSQISRILFASKSRLEAERSRLKVYRVLPGARRDTINNITTRIAGLETQVKNIESQDADKTTGLAIRELNDAQPVLQILENRWYTLRTELGKDEVKLSMLEMAQDAETPAIHIIEPAEIPQKKFKPKRSIMVLGATAAAFLFYIMALLIREGFKLSKSA